MCSMLSPQHAAQNLSTMGLYAFSEAADDGTIEEMSCAKAIIVRFGIMAVVTVVAALSFQVLGSVESIVGAVCSMSSSMLLPAFFFFRYLAR